MSIQNDLLKRALGKKRYGRVFEGRLPFGWNHKRVYRVYCDLELNLRIKPKKRLKRDKPEPLSMPDVLNDK